MNRTKRDQAGSPDRNVKFLPVMGWTIVILLLTSIGIFAAQVAYAQGTLDQVNDVQWRGGATNVAYYNSVGQSFKPSCPDLIGVDVALFPLNSRSGDTVTVKVLRDGEVIGITSTNVQPNFDGWWHVDFDNALSVTPGESLILQLEDTGQIVIAWKYVGNTYPEGTQLFYGNVLEGDFLFRTYAGSCPQPQPAIIDITPRRFPNTVHPNRRRPILVSILTSDATGNENGLDATTVDPATVRFGAMGTEATPFRKALKDVDRDGDIDVIFRFYTHETGIKCGDTFATLTGATFDGQAIEGTDSINTVGCR